MQLVLHHGVIPEVLYFVNNKQHGQQSPLSEEVDPLKDIFLTPHYVVFLWHF